MEIDGNTGIGGNPDVVVVVDRHARRGVLGSKFWQHVVRDVDWGGAIVGDGQSPVDEGYPEVAVGAKESALMGALRAERRWSVFLVLTFMEKRPLSSEAR